MGLTILTEPLSAYYRARTVARKYARRIPGNLGGHYSVTRSLLDGFKEIRFEEWNYRPNKSCICRHIHALSGIRTLQYAIELKKKGLADKVTAGPNLIGFPDDAGWKYLVDDNVDVLLFPSQNTIDYFDSYIDGIAEKSVPFASGINEREFYPENVERDLILIYSKNVSDYWSDYISEVIARNGYKPYVIHYGSYRLDEYKRILNRSRFMISLSKHDTQGLYLAEAWAMDCPTICWNSHFCSFPITETHIEGNQLGSPYVCKENGMMFETIEELEDMIKNCECLIGAIHPREWILGNMTDAICSRHFLELIGYNLVEKNCIQA